MFSLHSTKKPFHEHDRRATTKGISDDVVPFLLAFQTIATSTNHTLRLASLSRAQPLCYYHVTQGFRLAALVDSDRLTGLVDSDRLAGLGDSDCLAGLVDNDCLAGLVDSDCLAGLVDSDCLAGLVDSDRLAGLANSERPDSSYVHPVVRLTSCATNT